MASSTRGKLVQTAYEMFGRNGFHGVGIDRIIEEVGVTKTTFYNHFESKDDLILAVLRERHEHEMRTFQEALRKLGGINARGQLESIFAALADWFNQPDFRGCIFITAAAEFPMANDPAHQAAADHSHNFNQLIRELAEHSGIANPQELADELSLLVSGAIVARHVSGNEHAVWTADRIAQMKIDEHLRAAAADQQTATPTADPSPAVRTPRLAQ